MQHINLQPAGSFALNFGVKALVYGPPGRGKTPIINTAPRPVLLAIEPGLLSMKGSMVPTYRANTVKEIDNFFKWLTLSSEARNYDTVCIDSISEMASVHLIAAKANNTHGKKAYGEMAEDVMEKLRTIYYMQYKHTYLIAKQGEEDGANGTKKKRPIFPGQNLNSEVPHLFDEILHLDRFNIPGVGQNLAFRTFDNTGESLARDRSGKLAEYEPINLTNLFDKIMKG